MKKSNRASAQAQKNKLTNHSKETVSSIFFDTQSSKTQTFGKDISKVFQFNIQDKLDKIDLAYKLAARNIDPKKRLTKSIIEISKFEKYGKTIKRNVTAKAMLTNAKSFFAQATTGQIIKTGFATSLVVFLMVGSLAIRTAKPKYADDYIIFTSHPLTIDNTSFSIKTKDSRAQKVNSIFQKYKCPLEGMGEKFVEEADKNNIPWWLVASVAFKESTCGKATPKVDGVETFNAWGWGVWGGKAHAFENWARGIERVSRYFNESFYSKGITDTCAIMKIYTPPSDGSWCRDVNYFGNQIQNFETTIND